MRILVSGASGFIASHMIPGLVAVGHEVVAVSRSHMSRRDGGEVAVVGSQHAPDAWKGALEGVDAVVHLGGLAHRVGVPDEELDYHTPNVLVPEALAIAARAASVKRFVLVSSISVYGEPERIDSTTRTAPVNAYGMSKLEGERRALAAIRGSSTALVIIRPPLVYGPGNPGNLARLENLVRSGFPLPFGGMRAKRSYLYVGNLVDFVDHAVLSGACDGGTFTICDGDPVALREMLQGLADRLGVPCRIFSVPEWSLSAIAGALDRLPGHAVRGRWRYRDSISRLTRSLVIDDPAARAVTGWEPPFSFHEAVRLGGPEG
jgi:nucleoside-diphosphate-sugar epimerase